jgi:hypothetical protein
VGVGRSRQDGRWDGANLMLYFQLERGGDGMKCYRKLKRRQRARLGLMGKKHYTTRRRRPEERRHRGGKMEQTTLVGLT